MSTTKSPTDGQHSDPGKAHEPATGNPTSDRPAYDATATFDRASKATQDAGQQAAEKISASTAQLQQLGEQLWQMQREVGEAALDGYEKAVDSAIAVERQLAEKNQPEWLRSLINQHADFTRSVNASYVSTVRELLRTP